MRINRRQKLGREGLDSVRARAVEQVLAGKDPRAVIHSLGFSRGSIYAWLKKFRQGGWEALNSKHITGRPRRLTAAQLKWIAEALGHASPLDFNFPAGLWTRAMVAALVRERFQIDLSRASVVRLLRGLGCASGKPWRPFAAAERAVMERWVRSDYKRIESEARRARAEIVFLDIAPYGLPPVSGGHLLSAVSRKGTMRFMVATRRACPASVSEFIRRLMHGTKRPIFLIVPAHSVSQGIGWEECRQGFDGRLHFFLLPSAAPSLDELAVGETTHPPPAAAEAKAARFEAQRGFASTFLPRPSPAVPSVRPLTQSQPSGQSGVVSP